MKYKLKSNPYVNEIDMLLDGIPLDGMLKETLRFSQENARLEDNEVKALIADSTSDFHQAVVSIVAYQIGVRQGNGDSSEISSIQLKLLDTVSNRLQSLKLWEPLLDADGGVIGYQNDDLNMAVYDDGEGTWTAWSHQLNKPVGEGSTAAEVQALAESFDTSEPLKYVMQGSVLWSAMSDKLKYNQELNEWFNAIMEEPEWWASRRPEEAVEEAMNDHNLSAYPTAELEEIWDEIFPLIGPEITWRRDQKDSQTADGPFEGTQAEGSTLGGMDNHSQNGYDRRYGTSHNPMAGGEGQRSVKDEVDDLRDDFNQKLDFMPYADQVRNYVRSEIASGQAMKQIDNDTSSYGSFKDAVNEYVDDILEHLGLDQFKWQITTSLDDAQNAMGWDKAWASIVDELGKGGVIDEASYLSQSQTILSRAGKSAFLKWIRGTVKRNDYYNDPPEDQPDPKIKEYWDGTATQFGFSQVETLWPGAGDSTPEDAFWGLEKGSGTFAQVYIEKWNPDPAQVTFTAEVFENDVQTARRDNQSGTEAFEWASGMLNGKRLLRSDIIKMWKSLPQQYIPKTHWNGTSTPIKDWQEGGFNRDTSYDDLAVTYGFQGQTMAGWDRALDNGFIQINLQPDGTYEVHWDLNGINAYKRGFSDAPSAFEWAMTLLPNQFVKDINELENNGTYPSVNWVQVGETYVSPDSRWKIVPSFLGWTVYHNGQGIMDATDLSGAMNFAQGEMDDPDGEHEYRSMKVSNNGSFEDWHLGGIGADGLPIYEQNNPVNDLGIIADNAVWRLVNPEGFDMVGQSFSSPEEAANWMIKNPTKSRKNKKHIDEGQMTDEGTDAATTYGFEMVATIWPQLTAGITWGFYESPVYAEVWFDQDEMWHTAISFNPNNGGYDKHYQAASANNVMEWVIEQNTEWQNSGNHAEFRAAPRRKHSWLGHSETTSDTTTMETYPMQSRGKMNNQKGRRPIRNKKSLEWFEYPSATEGIEKYRDSTSTWVISVNTRTGRCSAYNVPEGDAWNMGDLQTAKDFCESGGMNGMGEEISGYAEQDPLASIQFRKKFNQIKPIRSNKKNMVEGVDPALVHQLLDTYPEFFSEASDPEWEASDWINLAQQNPGEEMDVLMQEYFRNSSNSSGPDPEAVFTTITQMLSGYNRPTMSLKKTVKRTKSLLKYLGNKKELVDRDMGILEELRELLNQLLEIEDKEEAHERAEEALEGAEDENQDEEWEVLGAMQQVLDTDPGGMEEPTAGRPIMSRRAINQPHRSAKKFLETWEQAEEQGEPLYRKNGHQIAPGSQGGWVIIDPTGSALNPTDFDSAEEAAEWYDQYMDRPWSRPDNFQGPTTRSKPKNWPLGKQSSQHSQPVQPTQLSLRKDIKLLSDKKNRTKEETLKLFKLKGQLWRLNKNK